MRKSTAMMLALGLSVTGCAEPAEDSSGDEGVAQPGDGNDFDGSYGYDGSQQGQSIPDAFIGQGSIRGDLAYVEGIDVPNAFTTSYYDAGMSGLVLEGVTDDAPVMVAIHMFADTSLNDFETGQTYFLPNVPNASVIGCVGPEYGTEIDAEEIEVEDVEEDPEIGETLYAIRLGFRYSGNVQNVYARVTVAR